MKNIRQEYYDGGFEYNGHMIKYHIGDEFKNKNFKVDPDDYENSYWFTPKIYGVPLKACFESYGSICITDNELKYD